MTGATLPTGTVTFLFTDIEGSTGLVKELGDRFPEILEQHHSLMRSSVTAAGGIEVATEGDSFFVVFTNPLAAVEAAVEAQRALRAFDWGEGIEVRVRMGIHTGAGALVGDNYGGLDVHRASRIMSAGHGGQILLSETTRALVEAELPRAMRVKDLGTHRLKDLDRREHIYQLCADGLLEDFPHLRSLEARPNNLPIALTPFIARDRQVEEIKRLLSSGRLVTLTGPGGTGKTRLSLEVAARCLMNFSDGAFAVFLSPVTDPDLLASTIAEALGVREQGLIPIAESLKSFLGDKEMLVVLDNFEQIIGAAAYVSDILTAAPRVKGLVTSRATLRISGEQEYPVPPMDLPGSSDVAPVEALTTYGSVELFVQRARAVVPDFELTERNSSEVVEICRRLDGLPLAIELAAARTRSLGPDEILARLERGLSVLSSGARDVPGRQRTLTAAIQWSYELLEDPLKALFRRLAVFVGGWTFDAMSEVCNTNDELGIDTLDGVEALIDNSLVRRTETDDGRTRFRMLQTIREFAREKMIAEDDRDMLEDRHTRYFGALVERVAPTVTSDSYAANLLETENDNLRAVLRRAIDRSDDDLALAMGGALWRFWQLRSHLEEGRRLLEEILSLPGAAARDSRRARAEMAIGSITYWQNDFDETLVHYREGLGIFREIDDMPGVMEALYNIAFIDLINRNPSRARQVFIESRSLAETLGDAAGVGYATWGLAMVALQERDIVEALRLGRETYDRFKELDHWWGMSLGRFVFFQASRYKGDYEEARVRAIDYLDQRQQGEDLMTAFSAMEMLSSVELAQGYHERALRLAGAAEAFRDVYGGGSPPPLIDADDPRDSLRGTLSDERIAELWAEGRQMTLDEAIAYARKDPGSG